MSRGGWSHRGSVGRMSERRRLDPDPAIAFRFGRSWPLWLGAAGLTAGTEPEKVLHLPDEVELSSFQHVVQQRVLLLLGRRRGAGRLERQERQRQGHHDGGQEHLRATAFPQPH
ncbi:hypothetical protein FOCC_FOCC017683 [Frankliniella occidentalis]|nr:hypothetical protein FOCC_FOCC017683 [Frankliniella occidentalis]